MSARFHVDLLHPGSVAHTWQEWFVGPRGARRLALGSLGGAAVLALVLGAAVLPAYWRLSSDLSAVPRLRRDLAAQEADLGVLRSNVQSLAEEAQRQVRWADLLAAIGQHIPSTLKLQLVEEAHSAPPAPGQAAGAGLRGEATLRIDAVTPLRPGSPTLLVIAQFMGGLMRDPAVNKRFHLKSWEMKPAAATGAVPLLNVSIVLAERTP